MRFSYICISIYTRSAEHLNVGSIQAKSLFVKVFENNDYYVCILLVTTWSTKPLKVIFNSQMFDMKFDNINGFLKFTPISEYWFLRNKKVLYV